MAQEVYVDPKILTVLLPDGEKILYKCDSRCPMMDLLVQITSIAKLKPSGYEIQPLNHDGDDATVLPFNPNTQIGAIDTQVVRIAPRTSGSSKYRLNKSADHYRSGPAISSNGSTNFKNRVNDFNNLSGTSAIRICNDPESMHQLSQPLISSRNNYIASTLTPVVSGGTIGVSCRVRVRLPRGQIHILRAIPQYPLQELYDLVCDERQMSPSKHVLVYTDDISRNVNLGQTLRECGTTELTIKALKETLPENTNVTKKSPHSSSIFGFLKKTLKKPAPAHVNHNGTSSSQGSSRRSSGSSSLPEAATTKNANPTYYTSMERLSNSHSTTINTIPDDEQDEFAKANDSKISLRSAKRQAPRPPSIVVTEVNDQKDGSRNDDLIPWEDSRRHSQHSSDMGNAANSSVPSTLMRRHNRNHLPRAVSMGALDGPLPPRAMPRKKRAAPTPPMLMSHEDLHSSALCEVQLSDKLDNIEEKDTKLECVENIENPHLENIILQKVVPDRKSRMETVELKLEDKVSAGLIVGEEMKAENTISHSETYIKDVEEEIKPENLISHNETYTRDVGKEIKSENTISHDVTYFKDVEEEIKPENSISHNETYTRDIEEEIKAENTISPNETYIKDVPKDDESESVEKNISKERPAEINIDYNANNCSGIALDNNLINDPVIAKNPLEEESSANVTFICDENKYSTLNSTYTSNGDVGMRTESDHFAPHSTELPLNSASELETKHQDTKVYVGTTIDIVNGEILLPPQNQTEIHIANLLSEDDSNQNFKNCSVIVEESSVESVDEVIDYTQTATKSVEENVQDNKSITLAETANTFKQRQESREKVLDQSSKMQSSECRVNNNSTIYISNNLAKEQTYENAVSTKPIIIEEVYKSHNKPIVVEMLKHTDKTKIETVISFDDIKHTVVNNEHSVDVIKEQSTNNSDESTNNSDKSTNNSDESSNDSHKSANNSDKITNNVVVNGKLYSAPRRVYTPPKFMLTTWVDDKKPTNGSWVKEKHLGKHYETCVYTSTPVNSPAETVFNVSPIGVSPKTPTKTTDIIVKNTNFKSTTNVKTLGSETELIAAKKLLRPVRTNSSVRSIDSPKLISYDNNGSAADKTALHAELLSRFVGSPPCNDVSASTQKPKKASPKTVAPLNYMVSLPDYHNQAWRDRVPLMRPVFGKQLSMKDVAKVVKPLHGDHQSQMYAAKREVSDSPPSWTLVKDANNFIKRNQSFGKNN